MSEAELFICKNTCRHRESSGNKKRRGGGLLAKNFNGIKMMVSINLGL
jgi:hypothetical protein